MDHGPQAGLVDVEPTCNMRFVQLCAAAATATEFALDELCPFVADWCDCTGAESLCGGVAFPTGFSGCQNWENQVRI